MSDDRAGAPRWSLPWIYRRWRRQVAMGPRIAIAALIPILIAFYCLELAAILAIPCGYIAWTQLPSLWPDL